MRSGTKGDVSMRTYEPIDIVALPRLSAPAAVALGQQLLTAARAKAGFPAPIASKLTAFQGAHAALHQALSQQKQVAADPKRARIADLAEDQAWSAFHDWLFGWTKLSRADADPIRTMYAVLFPTRLQFTKLAYKLEWAEADARLTRIAQDGFDALIDQFGGKRMLDHLIATHREYGEALGITLPGQDPALPGLREPLNAFLAKLRAYVLVVAAHVDDADPGSFALAEALLAPLRQWPSRASGSATPEVTSTSPNGQAPTSAHTGMT